MKNLFLSIPLWLCLTFLGLSFLLIAQEWTRFRGPNGSGLSDAKTVPTKWSKSDYKWKIKLDGIGHSSPVIWGNKLFITSGDGEKLKRYLYCIETADGSTIWKKEFGFEKYRRVSQIACQSGRTKSARGFLGRTLSR
jgi:outer membrane protein assembly factor BamB